MSGEILIADLETNGFKPTEIFIVGMVPLDTNDYKAYTGDNIAEGLIRLAEADYVIGHNFKGYDAKQICRLTDGYITIDDNKIIDTLKMSTILFPELNKHGLETWGEIFGFPKLKHSDFTKISPNMLTYCERDVMLNKMLYEFFVSQLIE